MLPLSTLAQSTLRNSHAVAARVSVTSSTFGSLENLPISGGSVTDDATNQVRRQASVYVADPSLWPEKPTDILSPIDAEMFIEYGIVVPGMGIEWCPLFMGTVSEVDGTLPFSGQGLTVSLVDRSQRIHDDQFANPAAFGGGTHTCVSVIQQLITRTLPDAAFIDLTGDTTVCPSFTVQQDPWTNGVEAVANSIGAEVFADPNGVWVIRYVPTLTDNEVWLINTGPNGNLVSNQRTQARTNVYNQVVVTAGGSSSSTPITATASDTDPLSPTNINGPFGRRPFFYTSSLIFTQAQAQTVANTFLARAQGASYSASLSVVANPALQSGDVIQLAGDTGNRFLIADTITHSLDLTAPQQIVGRTTEIGSISQIGE